MSRVFLAEETRLGRQVVVKVLPPEMGAAVNIERFEREIQLAARLQHPHVVSLLTAASSGDLLYYIMPYIAGESLRARLGRDGALPVPEAVRLLREIADALAYAHKHNVVHRDIKPDNVLLSTGHAVVTDFGVAKAVSASSGGHSSLTSLGVALGTPAYMAPEQAAADPNVDHRADIYAVGALAYEMLSGRTPFTSPTPQAMLAAHITQAPDPLSRHRSNVPAALNAIVMRCLEKHPADRYQTAGDLLAQLEVVLTPSGGMAPSEALPAVSSGTAEALKKSAPVRVIATFAAASIATLAVVWVAVQQFGLPDWVFYGAIVLLIIGLPIILATGYFERQRAQARATGRIIPPDVSGVHRIFTWRKAIRGGMLAFAGLAVLAIVYTVMRLAGIGPVGTLVASGQLNATDRLLVADFENRTPDSALAGSITEAFRIDLSQSKVVRILSTRDIGEGLQRMKRDPGTAVTGALARELATREGAKAVVAGEISAIGKSYVLAARIFNAADGTELVALRETAENDGAIVAALDRLSGAVRERIGESLKSIRGGEPLEQVTTSSLAALRLYTEGAIQNDRGHAELAVPLLEQAVALDSGFAMAWRKLAAAISNNQGSEDRIVDAATRAYQHRDRLPDLERELASAFYFNKVVSDQAREEAAYRRVLEAIPRQFVATNNLALNLLAQGRAAEADSLVTPESEAATHPTNAHTQWLGASVSLGQVEETHRRLALLNQRFPNDGLITWITAYSRTALHEYDEGQRAYARLALIPGYEALGHNGLAAIAFTRGQLNEGFRQGQLLTRQQTREGLRHADLSNAILFGRVILQFKGDTAAALRLVADALVKTPLESLPPHDRPRADLATLYTLAGKAALARQQLDLHEKEVAEGWRRGRVSSLQARGWVALSEGRPADAMTAFEAARHTSDCWQCGDWELAVAFERAGLADSAFAAYQRAAAIGSVNKPNSSDPLGLAASYRRLGELFEERKDPASALESYGKLAELWKDADPILQPRVREVMARMAKLAGEPK
jgi:serine/threonine-protein kinase